MKKVTPQVDHNDMKKVFFVPTLTKFTDELKYIATNCGHCDDNFIHIGGKFPKKVYKVEPKK
jgi:hypothetical protein